MISFKSLENNYALIEDLVYDNSSSLLSDYLGSVVIAILLAIVCYAMLIFFLIGMLQEIYQERPIGTVSMVIGSRVLVSLVCFVSIRSEIRKKRKEAASEVLLNETEIEKSPISHILLNNQNNEYKEHTCPICKEEILNSIEIVAYPQYKVTFHLTHLLNWIEKSDECSNCHFKMK